MKFTKVLTASAVALALSASMSIVASAATWSDAVQAAKDCGVQSHNVQELSNFLEPNKDYFTAAQYDEMIADMKAVSDKYVAPKAQELFNKTPGELTEDEKVAVGKTWSRADKDAIIKDLVDLGAKYNVEVDVTKVNAETCNVSAKLKDGSGTQTTTTSPIANTGNETAEPTTGSSAVAFAGVALVLASTGAVIVSRKNRV